MKAKSTASRTVRFKANDLPAASSAEMAALKRRSRSGVANTSDIAESRVGKQRGESTSACVSRGMLQAAILAELGHRGLTRYELWKRAHAHCPKLPESAVYEFLRGTRQVGVEYVEAMLQALDLCIRPAA